MLKVDQYEMIRIAHRVYGKNISEMMITDIDGGLLISEFDYAYPIWIYDASRAYIGYNQKKAQQLRRWYE